MSVTAPQGFRAAGVTAGLKPSGTKDLALVVNDGPEFASAAACPPSAARPAYAASTPSRRAVRSFVRPMRPVEQTTTSIAPTPRCPATCSATAWVVRNPSGPV